jgi:hypothetical protein
MERKLNADGRKWGARIKLKRGFKPSLQPNAHLATNLHTRQIDRDDVRRSAWHKWRCFRGPMGEIDQAPRDDRGVMSRRIRRSIARAVAKQAYKIMGRKGTTTNAGR